MHLFSRLFLLPALLLPATAYAAGSDSAAPLPVEHRLSQAEIDKVLDGAAAKREAAEKAEDRPARRIHGEVGFAIGTGGYRSAFGTAVVPILDDGVAIMSFETSRSKRPQPYWGYPY